MAEEISIKEFAKLRHISEWTVRRLMREGLLEFHKYGRIYRIRVDAHPMEREEKYPKVFRSTQEFCAMIDAL